MRESRLTSKLNLLMDLAQMQATATGSDKQQIRRKILAVMRDVKAIRKSTDQPTLPLQ